MHEQLQDQKQANEENKQKMEQKFFVEKNKMEREVSFFEPKAPGSNLAKYFLFYRDIKSILGESQNWSIC